MATEQAIYRFTARALDLIEQAIQEQIDAFSWARLAVDDRKERSDISNAHQRRRELKALLKKVQQRNVQDLALDSRAIALIEHAIRDQIKALSFPESRSTMGFVQGGDSEIRLNLKEAESLLDALRDRKTADNQMQLAEVPIG